MNPATTLSLGAFHGHGLGQAHMPVTHRTKLRLLSFQVPAAQNPQMVVTEQVTSDRPPEEIGECLLCREPTFKAEKKLSVSMTTVRFQNDVDRKMKFTRALEIRKLFSLLQDAELILIGWIQVSSVFAWF